MAKDGTARGGARVGSGRKPKTAAKETPTKPKTTARKKKSGIEMPEYMTEKQEKEAELTAVSVYQDTIAWIKERGCEQLVPAQLVRNYAMSVARWIQCEHDISQNGFIAEHPTTGAPIASPVVTMSQNYMKQINNLWYQIYQIVSENSSAEMTVTTDDPMEQLLRSRR